MHNKIFKYIQIFMIFISGDCNFVIKYFIFY